MRHSVGIFSAILFIVLAAGVQAQARFDASVWGGLAMGQIDGDGAGSYNHPGLTAGVESSFALGDIDSPLRAMVGVGFMQKGSHVSNIGRIISLNYVEIPVMLTASFSRDRLRAGLGFAPAVLVAANVHDDGVDNPTQSGNYRRFDALPFLASVRYLLSDHFGFELRYENSLLPVTKQSGSGTYRIVRSNQGAFNRLLTIGIVYRWLPSR
ncbi:MAG: PorT family protein [Bacteroidales bacterium]|nr:PorT family protein [Bacteroidales bacterium]